MKHRFQVTIGKGLNVLVGSEEPVKPGGFAELPLVIKNNGVFPYFQKNIARKDGLSGCYHLSLAADGQFPLGKVDSYGAVRVQRLKEAYIFFFCAGFYLNGVVVHGVMVANEYGVVQKEFFTYTLNSSPVLADRLSGGMS
jgi:hypothetical protein